MTEPRTRSTVFGEAADEYDAVRPDYPAELAGDLLAAAGPGPVLEVGAGTGKATVTFAAHGPDLVALEPDARMAALLEKRALPGVEVVVDRFETWSPPRPFGLLYSAQAWHWVDRERRNDLAAAALAPGGLLGLFWNAFQLESDVFQALNELDRKYWPGNAETMNHWQTPAQPGPEKPFAEEWAELQLHDDSRFTDLQSHKYQRVLTYSATDYARFLATTSLFRMLPAEKLSAITIEIVQVIEQRGGSVDVHAETHLATARRV